MSTAPMRLLETWKLSRRHSWSTKQVYDMVRLSSVPVSERFLRTVRPQLCKALPGRINQSPPWRPDSSKFVASFQPSSVWIGIPLACGLQRSRPGAVYLPAGFLIRLLNLESFSVKEKKGFRLLIEYVTCEAIMFDESKQREDNIDSETEGSSTIGKRCGLMSPATKSLLPRETRIAKSFTLECFVCEVSRLTSQLSCSPT
ncbi:hypothetical protein HZH68_007512 [Vespula germanica]|uniref:Uncharacterized protein n=1 Tax=Vespula germanica TaxID=30212 RepID=A0A834K7T0_VESGE|nr:hypothetical protein HZH68_007512 [Vespula germanica]